MIIQTLHKILLESLKMSSMLKTSITHYCLMISIVAFCKERVVNKHFVGSESEAVN